MFKHLIMGALISFSCSPVLAAQSLGSVNNNAQNTQSNNGTVNLAPMGGSNANYQINSVSNSQFGFAPGIQCPTPELAFGAFGGQTTGWGNTGYNSSGNNIGGTIMFTTPIGGDTAKYCKQLAKEIAKQRRLDTEINMIKQCAALANASIQIDVEKFPDFSVCSAVSVADGRTAVLEEPERIFTPEETAVPVIEVSQDLRRLNQSLQGIGKR